jgi:hypothetical protein
MSNVEFIPIGYMTYNWINVIASIIIMGFAIWFSVSDEFDITTQNIWVPSVIAITLLCALCVVEFANKITLLKNILKNIMIFVFIIILLAIGSSFAISLVLATIILIIIMKIPNITKLILTYKTLFFILLFMASITSYIFFTI